jgi:uncharacterized OB-fold protein
MSEILVRPAPARGMYDGPLWEAVDKGEFRLQRCGDCGFVRYPPTGVCPQCLSENYKWDLMSGRGKILSWCVFYREYFPEIPPPNLVVLAEIEEGPIVVADIPGGDATQLRLDLPVKLVFEPVKWNDGKEGKIFHWSLAK